MYHTVTRVSGKLLTMVTGQKVTLAQLIEGNGYETQQSSLLYVLILFFALTVHN